MHRRQVDDAAPALAVVGGLHGRQRQARGMKRAAQVDGDDGVPLFSRKIFNSRDVLDAGVIDQDIDLAKLCGGELHHGFDLGRFAHVGTVVSDLDTARSNLGLGAFHIAKAVEHNIGPLFGECLGNAQTNTAGRACDECRFTFEHLVSPDDLRWLT